MAQLWGIDPLEQQRTLLRHAFDLGITHLDLANNYGPPPGSAEENFGQILRTDFAAHRDELVISTKAGYLMWPGPYGDWGSRKYLLTSLEQSLRRLRTDYVDIFYHHRPDPETPLEETMGALAAAVRSGKALYAGISNTMPSTPAKPPQFCAKWACPCSSTNRATTCSIAGLSQSSSSLSLRLVPVAFPSPRSPKVF